MAIADVEARSVSGIPLNKFGSLPALPEVTGRILAALKDPQAGPAELAKLISSDVALSACVLKVVNSVFYGLPRQVSTIDRAVVVLGRNAVRNVTIAASMASVFNSTGRMTSTVFDLKSLWVHSSASAVAARMISNELRRGDPDELFLAGLTHDIGIMAEMYWSYELLFGCVEQLEVSDAGVPQRDLMALETTAFGFDHQRIGKEACHHWNFPPAIGVAAGHHHNPLELQGNDRFVASVVYVADRLTAGLRDSFRLDLMSTDIDSDVLDELHMDEAMLEKILDLVTEHLQEAANMFS